MRVTALFVLLSVAAACCLAAEDREFEEFVERHQHLIPAETKERLFRERRARPGQ